MEESTSLYPQPEGTPGEPPTPAPLDEERDPFWGYVDIGIFFGLAVPAFLLGYALVKAFKAVFHLQFAARAVEPLLLQSAFYVLLFGGLMLLFRVYYERPFWQSLGWKPLGLPPLAVIAAGLGSALAVAAIGTLLAVPNTPNSMTDLMKDRTSLAALTIFGMTLGPLCEELAFRGFLQPLLVRSLGTVAGILAAAAPFGLLHYQEYGNSWKHALVVGAAGAAFGFMRHVTGSTKAAALMHAAYNGLFFGVLLAGRAELLR
jgi:uncharacterized protein